MGYDKFVSFLSKNLSNKCYDDIYPLKNIEGCIISKYIYYDINFIIYKCIHKVEEDINNIIKVFNGIEENKELKIKNYIENNNIKKYISFDFLNRILNADDRINYFKNSIDSVINNIIYDEILNYILFSTYSIHKPYFIKNVLIFFDGIPGYSKILEQRKRRIYNYLNSLNRKKYYNEYFKDDFNFIKNDENINIKYDYFNYIKNTYSINKNFGPQSVFLLELSKYLKNNLANGNKIKLFISDGNIPGEADYKILKHIEDNKIIGDISIHSCDSDFLYFVILYQLKNQNNYLNLNLVKYSNNSYNLYNGKNLIELFQYKYKNDNKINDNLINLNFLYDILFIIQMFGNDLIPDNFEISSEINLSIFFKCHYKLYENNDFIININSEKTINFKNFLKFLQILNEYNLFSINLLGKFFKINKRIISIVCCNLKFNINNFINNLIIPYLKYEAFLFKDNIDADDIRYEYINQSINVNPINNLNLDQESKLYLNENFKYIFNYINKEDYGLIRLTTNCDVCDNPFDSLYNFIVTNSINETYDLLNTSFKFYNINNSFNEYNNFTKNVDVSNYLEILENQTKILFYDFNCFNSKNKIYCKYNTAPSIKNIIDYLHNNDFYSKPKIQYNSKYFDSVSHHLIITPYLLDNLNYLSDENEYLPNIMNIMNYYIDNIFDVNKINLRNIHPDVFLNKITELYKLFEDCNIKRLYINKNILL